eukprot:278599-Amphidinium_carterae.1
MCGSILQAQQCSSGFRGVPPTHINRQCAKLNLVVKEAVQSCNEALKHRRLHRDCFQGLLLGFSNKYNIWVSPQSETFAGCTDYLCPARSDSLALGLCPGFGPEYGTYPLGYSSRGLGYSASYVSLPELRTSEK